MAAHDCPVPSQTEHMSGMPDAMDLKNMPDVTDMRTSHRKSVARRTCGTYRYVQVLTSVPCGDRFSVKARVKVRFRAIFKL